MMFFFKLPVRSVCLFRSGARPRGEGRRWRRSVGPPLESGVPSRSPGLRMTGVSRRGRPRSRPAPVTFGACALNFKDSFRATGSPAGKIRTFRARRILVSRAWHRQRGERARRPPGGAGRRATTGTTRQAWAEASALPRHLLRVPQDRTLQPCEVASYARAQLSAWLASWLLSLLSRP